MIRRIGYHIRTGGHGFESYDQLRYHDFVDKHWKGNYPRLVHLTSTVILVDCTSEESNNKFLPFD